MKTHTKGFLLSFTAMLILFGIVGGIEQDQIETTTEILQAVLLVLAALGLGLAGSSYFKEVDE